MKKWVVSMDVEQREGGSIRMREVTCSIPALATAFGQFVKFGVSVISVS